MTLYDQVFRRDGERCLAPLLDPDCGPCGDQWGRALRPGRTEGLTQDHIKDQPMMGKKAPTDIDHLVTLCWKHHVLTGWATGHRPLLRDYLASFHDGRRATVGGVGVETGTETPMEET